MCGGGVNVGCQSGFGFFENVLWRCLGGLKVCQIRMGSGRLRLEVIGREKRKGKKGRVSFLGHPLFSSLALYAIRCGGRLFVVVLDVLDGLANLSLNLGGYLWIVFHELLRGLPSLGKFVPIVAEP